jgi:hypothetical protein
MRFSNYTGFRLFTPKYAQTRIRLISVAGGQFVLSCFIGLRLWLLKPRKDESHLQRWRPSLGQ